MAIWDRSAPVGQNSQSYSIRGWVDDRSAGWTNPDGSEVSWWQGPNLGVQFINGICSGAFCEPMETDCLSCGELNCDECGTTDDKCVTPAPGWEEAKPFWVKQSFDGCSPHERDPDATYQSLLSTLDVTQWPQMAKRYHAMLQANATVINTGGTAASITEGLGALLRQRGVAGLNWGSIVIPGYALPAIESRNLIKSIGGRPTTVGDMPVFSDPGIPISGPGGVAPPPGAAYIYIVPSTPVGAILPENQPGGSEWSWSNQQTRSMFYDPNCCGNGCYKPLVKRRAVIATDTCGIYAIPIDLRDCGCPDPLVIPEGKG